MNKKIKQIASISAFAFFTFIAIGSGKDKKSTTEAAAVNSEEKATFKKVGETLPTEYFDVTVSNVSVKNSVNTGNQFSNLPAEQGSRYLILDVSFKNTSEESRMLMDGVVIINYNGKDYNFDKSETVMADGWGLLLDQINPLTTKTKKLVYKIPAEIIGNAYYKPARSGSNDIIDLGIIE